MRALLTFIAVAAFATSAAAAPSVSVCAGSKLASNAAAASLTTCLTGDDSSVGFTTNANIGSSQACVGGVTVTRTLGDTESHVRVIKVTPPTGRKFRFKNTETAIQILPALPTSPCQLDSTAASGNGIVKTGVVNVKSSVGTKAHVCAGGSVSEKGAGTNSVVTIDDSTTATCTGGITDDTGLVDEFAFVYQCPELKADAAGDVHSYVRVGSVNDNADADSYAVIDVTCAAEVPSNDFCVRFTYCTPYSASSNAGTFANTCAAESATVRDALIAKCEEGDVFACSTTANQVQCSTCPNVLNLPGMRYNSFRVQAASQAQIDRVVASVRAGLIASVPAWATVEQSTDKCSTFVPVPCTTTACAVPSGIYPDASQKSGVVARLTAEQVAVAAEAYADERTFEADGQTVTANLIIAGGTVTAGATPGTASATTPSGSASATVSTRRQTASVTVGTADVVVTSSCPNSLAGSTTAPTAPTAPTSGSASGTLTTAGCCEAFYTYVWCDLQIQSFTACSCGGSATCPINVPCPSSSSNKSLLHLLWLLCIPFWICILCSIIIACCLIRRRKRGWQERQLATFDPEPHPAAPPPPVNVYEECPAYAHHDGASGYSDVHHTTDEYYSQA